jgi:hypothetical protein
MHGQYTTFSGKKKGFFAEREKKRREKELPA